MNENFVGTRVVAARDLNDANCSIGRFVIPEGTPGMVVTPPYEPMQKDVWRVQFDGVPMQYEFWFCLGEDFTWAEPVPTAPEALDEWLES